MVDRQTIEASVLFTAAMFCHVVFIINDVDFIHYWTAGVFIAGAWFIYKTATI